MPQIQLSPDCFQCNVPYAQTPLPTGPSRRRRCLISAGAPWLAAKIIEAAGGNYKVVKNTIAERAAEGTPTEGLLKNLKGTNSIAYTKTDPVTLAKILTKVAKDTPAFQFRAGWVEGRVISIQEIGQLATLPSKEELISKIMFMLNAPAQRVASVLAAVPRNLAVVTSEAAKAKRRNMGRTP